MSIDFDLLARALLDDAEALLQRWLPGGRRRGDEYVCGGIGGGPGDSFRVNIKTGRWAEFAGDERGGDMVSLYAAKEGIGQAVAARRLDEFGFGRAPPPAVKPQSKPQTSLWRPILPVPANAPEPSFRHWHHTTTQAHWAYRRDGELLGYVVRFATSDGGKEILPLTWCVDESDDRGTRRWHWKQWDAPRPLYLSSGALSPREFGRTVFGVEGEKCALEAHRVIGDVVDCVSWPGGGKAWRKAEWRWLAHRRVVLWADCDAQHVPLTRAEKAAGVDPTTKPFLPPGKQPGVATMRALAAHLTAEHGCDVKLCRIPAPGERVSGWDVADAIAEGWTRADLLACIESAEPLQPTAIDAQHGGARRDANHAASGDASDAEADGPPYRNGSDPPHREPPDEPQCWRDLLLRGTRKVVLAVRENVACALDGVRELHVDGIEATHGLLAWNEFTHDLLKLRAPPWGGMAGDWTRGEELAVGEYLARHHGLPSMARSALSEGVQLVARRRQVHPVRDWLRSLDWNGARLLDTWLPRVCVAGFEDEDWYPRPDLPSQQWDEREKLLRYLSRAGACFLMGACARVLEPREVSAGWQIGPGCKFDYMLVLEAPQGGERKSGLFDVLGGIWYADSKLDLRGKDAFEVIQGVWFIEQPELHSFHGVGFDGVKAFVSSRSDRYRPAYGDRVFAYPRQAVICGTTNRQGHADRRFWCVPVTRRIDLEWVKEVREQLFAEAVARLDADEPYFPGPAEEAELFAPQKFAREVQSPMVERTLTLVNSPTADDGKPFQHLTATGVLTHLGIPVERQTRAMVNDVLQAFRAAGWQQDGSRDDGVGRPRVWRRPTAPTAGAPSAGRVTSEDDASVCPF